MKDQGKDKIVLLTLNDNSKLEGVLIKIDKENLKIILENGKLTDPNGKVETFEKSEIFKKDIKEIRLVEEKDRPKEEKEEKIETKIPDSTNENSAFNAIPMNIQEKYLDESSKYEKGGFFDGLTISNNKDNYKDVRTYNERNKETFGLDDTHYNNGNKRGQRRVRRGGYHSNRGGNNYNHHSNYSSYNNHHSHHTHHANVHHSHQNHNNQNSYSHNNNNYNQGYNQNQGSNQGYDNYNQNYNQGRGGRGSYQGNSRGGRGGYGNYNTNENSQQYSSNQFGVKSETSSTMTNTNTNYMK